MYSMHVNKQPVAVNMAEDSAVTLERVFTPYVSVCLQNRKEKCYTGDLYLICEQL